MAIFRGQRLFVSAQVDGAQAKEATRRYRPRCRNVGVMASVGGGGPEHARGLRNQEREIKLAPACRRDLLGLDLHDRGGLLLKAEVRIEFLDMVDDTLVQDLIDGVGVAEGLAGEDAVAEDLETCAHPASWRRPSALQQPVSGVKSGRSTSPADMTHIETITAAHPPVRKEVRSRARSSSICGCVSAHLA